MNIEYMETMAREYNRQLRFGGVSSESYISAAIDIVERQLDIITCCIGTYRQNKALLYLESLKRMSLKELMSLSPAKTVAECKDKKRQASSFNTVINLEVDLFINLDYIKESNTNIDSIMDIETRALGFMGLIR